MHFVYWNVLGSQYVAVFSQYYFFHPYHAALIRTNTIWLIWFDLSWCFSSAGLTPSSLSTVTATGKIALTSLHTYPLFLQCPHMHVFVNMWWKCHGVYSDIFFLYLKQEMLKCRVHSAVIISYRSRLKVKNLMYIKQILFMLEGLVRTLGGQLCVCVLDRGRERGGERVLVL